MRRLVRHPAARGVAAIVGGTGLGQIVLLLSAPVLSRLYPPGVFGPFAVVNSVVLPVAIVLALRLDMAVPLPKEDHVAEDLVSLGLASALVLGIVAEAIVFATRAQLAQPLGLPKGQADLLLWVPVVGCLMAIFTMLNQAAIRGRLYSAIARRNVLQNVAVCGFQILGGVAGLGAHGLAAGLALGQLVGVVSLMRSVQGAGAWQASLPSGVGDLLRAHRNMPLILMPSGLVNSVGVQAPVMLTSAFYGSQVAGYLGMTQRVLLMPIALVGLALAQVFLGEFGAAHRAGSTNLERRFLQTTSALTACGALLAATLVFLAPILFPLVLGHAWTMSGTFAQGLAVGVAAQMVASPLSQTLIVLGRQLHQAAWDVGRLVLVAGAVWLGYARGLDAASTIRVLGGATALAYFVAWLLSWRAVRWAGSTPSI